MAFVLIVCENDCLGTADLLIKARAAIERLDVDIPLMEATAEGYLDLVQYLLKSGADVHAHNQMLEEENQESYTAYIHNRVQKYHLVVAFYCNLAPI